MKDPKNLIVVTLDCVRPDHLGCYGYHKVETPNIDFLAMEGILFEQAITPAPNTWVSHGSLFTGCNPYAHGIRAPYQKLSIFIETIAERLLREGYRTAGFPGNSLVGRALGFDRGFQYFDEVSFKNPLMIKDVAWRRGWKSTMKRIEEWLTMDQRPFFLWIHYIDTHHLPEIDLPDYYRRRFSPDYQFYDGKISYADEVCIGALRNIVEGNGLMENTILIILSDHGEELGTDDIPRHDNDLRDETIKIPLIIAWPGLNFKRKRIPEQVRSIDIMPTAMELMGIDLDRNDSFFEGTSLIPLMKEKCMRDEGDYLAYIENLPKGLRGVRKDEWKLIVRISEKKGGASNMEIVGLYHLPSDPMEKRDLSGERPSVLEYMKGKILDFIRKEREIYKGTTEMEKQEKMRIEIALRQLGYME